VSITATPGSVLGVVDESVARPGPVAGRDCEDPEPEHPASVNAHAMPMASLHIIEPPRAAPVGRKLAVPRPVELSGNKGRSTGGTMQFDLLLDPFGARWTEVRDAAAAAVDAGFAGLWTYDHLDGRVYDAPFVLECWTVLSALAVAAPGVMLGPLVLNVQNRHPGVLATMVATLQEVSGGRLMLGLGAGAGPGTRYAREQEAVGRPVHPDGLRRAQVDRCIQEMRRLWQRPGFLAPEPRPPFVIGVLGPKMAELAGRVGDGFNTSATHPRLPELVEIGREAHARSGRDPEGFLVTVHTAFDERWLAGDSPARTRLATIGPDRLILDVSPPYDRRRIADAGRLLRG
jgi:alkanesulfonate monooxygenase SsuD/methylene tetrahydromethanopterin reductase-like flavin-dependent oxidoreductase (luciferase family)